MRRKAFDRRNFLAGAAIVIAVLLFVRPSTLTVASAQDANANKKTNTNTSAPKKPTAKKPVAKKSTPKKSPTRNSNTSKVANAAAGRANSSRPSATDAQRKSLTRLTSSETAEGSSITIFSNLPFDDYSAYRGGDRFYVLIPGADASRLVTDIRGRGFTDVRSQKRGNDVLLSFHLLAGAAARVSQKFNRLEILITVPALVAANATTNTSNTIGATQTDPSSGKPFRNVKGIEMIWIPPGSFDMGSKNGSAEEKPVHRVTISQGFFMGKYEVTQAQWQSVMGANPSRFKGDNLPVETVSWNDVQEFISKLNEMDNGYKYRMPTEAEWEYACRAGTTTEFALGSSLSSDQANFDGYYPYGGAAKGVYREKTTSVGSFAPNAFGLFDVHGNVSEWCEDWYHATHAGAPSDGTAWLSGGEQTDRVLRGGSWISYAAHLRSASRVYTTPDRRSYLVGFRLVAVVRTQ